MTKIWEKVASQKIMGKKSETYKFQVDGGHIYLFAIENEGSIRTETSFVPDVSTFALIIDKVKKQLSEIAVENWDNGEYEPGLIPKDVKKKKRKDSVPNFPPKEWDIEDIV